MSATQYRNSRLVPYYILGRGSISQLKSILDEKRQTFSARGCVVIVIDHFFKDKNLFPIDFTSEKDLVIYADTTDEPTTEYVDSLKVEIVEKGLLPEVFVGIGGGSALDITKALSVLMNNPGKCESYQGWDLVKNRAVYKIGIPTIAGTGAEFTRTAVVSGPVKKLGINSDYSVFDQVILDANLLKTVPNEQFIYTAMDCFVHNEESLLGRINDSMTIALAESSQKIITDVFLNQMDHERLLVASGFGGLAVANSSVGICHPFSYGLGKVLGLHHGYSICIAFNHLEEYYPNVRVFREILRKYRVELPRVTRGLSDSQLDLMADLVLMNERPLSNAFGNQWREKFPKQKVISLLKQM